MSDYEFPWGDKFWLGSTTGIAKNVKLDKRNRVYTTTRHETHSTSSYDYMTGRTVNGTVYVPVNDVHTVTDVESSFWIVNDIENEHFSFDYEIIPMLDGHRISVVWGALKGKEKGTYKYIYNHNTGFGTFIPKSFSDLGIIYPRKSIADTIFKFLFWITFFVLVFSLAFVLVDGSFGPSLTLLIILVLIGTFDYQFVYKPWHSKVNIIKSRANYTKNIINEYVKKL